MRTAEEPFDLEVDGNLIRVAEFEIGEKRIFHLDFKGASKPLIITVATSNKDDKFWTSIPEGRQKEAEKFGKLIANHIRNKKK